MGDLIIKYEIKDEVNTLEFKTEKETISSEFYLWNDENNIIIVDFDGTITKSDIGGHFYGTFGYDYSHEGSIECKKKYSFKHKSIFKYLQ